MSTAAVAAITRRVRREALITMGTPPHRPRSTRRHRDRVVLLLRYHSIPRGPVAPHLRVVPVPRSYESPHVVGLVRQPPGGSHSVCRLW
jgi:hypothetical protein